MVQITEYINQRNNVISHSLNGLSLWLSINLKL